MQFRQAGLSSERTRNMKTPMLTCPHYAKRRRESNGRAHPEILGLLGALIKRRDPGTRIRLAGIAASLAFGVMLSTGVLRATIPVAEADHAFDSNGLVYNKYHLDMAGDAVTASLLALPDQNYLYCRWGTLLSQASPIAFNDRCQLTFSYLTQIPYSGANKDLFITPSTSVWPDIGVLSPSMLVNAVWQLPSSILGSITPGNITFDAPDIYGTFSLFRKLHFTTVFYEWPGLNTPSQLTADSQKLIIMVHGWNRSEDSDMYGSGEFLNLGTAIHDQIAGYTEWKLMGYHWEPDADTGPAIFGEHVARNWGPINGAEAAEIAHQHGLHLGQVLANNYTHLKAVHFLAHSAGAWCARAAAIYLMQHRPDITVQVTLLDPFIPGSSTLLGIPDVGTTSLTVDRMQDLAAATLNPGAYLLENYYSVDATGSGTQQDFKWRADDVKGFPITYPSSSIPGDNIYGDWPPLFWNGHSAPIQFYADTVATTVNGGTVPSNLAGAPYAGSLQSLGWWNSLFWNEPIILQKPGDQSVNAGDQATISIVPSTRRAQFANTAPGSFGVQWYQNGNLLPGQTSTTLTLGNTTAASAGEYTAVVTNLSGSTQSPAMTLTVNGVTGGTPAITQQPADQSVIEGQTATFVVEATGDGTLSYQWSCNGATIPGAIAARYSTSPVALTNDGDTYQVVVTNGKGSQSSRVATLNVVPASPPDGNNHSSAQAAALANGIPAIGYISSPTEVDWFKVDITTPGPLTFTLTVPSDKDYDLELFGPDGAYIKGSYGGTGVAEGISYNATAIGTYYVRIYGYPVGNGSFSTTENYSLSVIATQADGALTNGGKQDGVIEVGDTNTWTFTAQANDNLLLRVARSSTGTNFEPWIRLYGPDGTLLGQDWQYTDAEVNFRATATGTYTVVIAGRNSGDSGSYRLRYLAVPGTFIVPAGDDGGALTNGGNQDGMIELGDIDAWTFTAQANNSLLLRVGRTSSGTNFEPWIRLYGPDGTLLGQDWQSTDAEVNFRATATGTYTVVIAGRNSGDSGSYRLRYLAVPGTFIVPAGDDGGALTNGGNQDGMIELGDIDAWTFTAQANNSLLLRVGRTSSGTNFEPWIRIYGPDGTLLGEDWQSTDAEVNYRATATGTYTVVIAGRNSGDSGTYQLTLTGNVPLVAPSITIQPGNQTVTASSNASFTVAASGTPAPTLQWQMSANGGSFWTSLTPTAPYSGTTTGTLTVTGATISMSGYQYRCIATNGVSPDATSNTATMTVVLSDQAFLQRLFLGVLGRPIDSGALAGFGSAMAGGESRTAVLGDLLGSAEYGAWQIEPAIRLYYAALARSPDYNGLQNWSNALHAGALTLPGAANQFAASAEFVLKYGSLDNTGYVQQLYRNVLGREADPAGLADWVGQLNSGASRGTILVGFSESPEFQKDMANQVEIVRLYYLLLQRMPTTTELQSQIAFLNGDDQTDTLFTQEYPAGLADSDYVQMVFQGFLRRPADAGALSTFAGALTAGTLTHDELVDTLLGSAEFNQYVAPVSRLYMAAFRRVPDAGGLDNWVNYVRAGNSLQSAADYFASSQEFQLTYGSLNNTQYVTLLYENVLGREPDPTGLADWVTQLNGGASRGQVLTGFSESQEGIHLFAPTVRTFLHYFTFLNTTPTQSDLDYWKNYLATLDDQLRDDFLADPSFASGG
jgi:Domain of unknown function (DUF4214)/Immunoglobulin domain/Immunoglobulin I-set domain